jgi:hypothetical protein
LRFYHYQGAAVAWLAVQSLSFVFVRLATINTLAAFCLCAAIEGALAQSVPPITAADAAVAIIGRFDLQEYVRRADRIVVARVEAVTSRLGRNSYGDEMIVSTALLRVERSLKGSLAIGGAFTIDFPGGQVGNLRLSVSHVAAFEPSERAVVFMVQGPTRSSVLGGETGKLEVDLQEMIPSLGQSLDEFVEEVSRALR